MTGGNAFIDLKNETEEKFLDASWKTPISHGTSPHSKLFSTGRISMKYSGEFFFRFVQPATASENSDPDSGVPGDIFFCKQISDLLMKKEGRKNFRHIHLQCLQCSKHPTHVVIEKENFPIMEANAFEHSVAIIDRTVEREDGGVSKKNFAVVIDKVIRIH